MNDNLTPMKTVAVILSGCGVFDGAEVHESVLTLLAIDKAGANYVCAAPNKSQSHVINHHSGQQSPDSRNVLEESARIARGPVKEIKELNLDDFDAVILPGGFGAAKNLSNFAFDAQNLKVDEDLASFLEAAHKAGKPIGFACIAPAIAARLFGEKDLNYTIGNDQGTADALNQWGATHINCPVNDIVVDQNLKVVTTPAYMLAQRISEADAGLSKMVRAVLEMS